MSTAPFSQRVLETPTIVSVAEQSAAIIKIIVPKAAIRAVMPPAIKELTATLAAQGIAPAGPMFTHHLAMDDAVFDFEVGFPIDGSLAETGRLRFGRLPEVVVARAIYRGGYEGLSAAWGELRQWTETNGHQKAIDLWEVYALGPETGSNTAEWRTELNQPISGHVHRRDDAADYGSLCPAARGPHVHGRLRARGTIGPSPSSDARGCIKSSVILATSEIY
ncbi:GyrI-like domain-containing protein [Hansschlegelia quercus]|uniref:GyrI-like domain-containing protein n=1 Tax=Hansschlegelia quercus TaxID=2528245 RepID=UPI0013EF5035|nr:GyrI-like domain-containing protein [Hansschlegelia quercus]